jgi:hypothetical protein
MLRSQKESRKLRIEVSQGIQVKERATKTGRASSVVAKYKYVSRLAGAIGANGVSSTSI